MAEHTQRASRATGAVLHPSREQFHRRALLRAGAAVGLTPLLSQTRLGPRLVRGASAQERATTLTPFTVRRAAYCLTFLMRVSFRCPHGCVAWHQSSVSILPRRVGWLDAGLSHLQRQSIGGKDAPSLL